LEVAAIGCRGKFAAGKGSKTRDHEGRSIVNCGREPIAALSKGLPLFSEIAAPTLLKLMSSKAFPGVGGGADLSGGVNPSPKGRLPGQHLSRIEDRGRIERVLDPMHQRQLDRVRCG